MKRIAYILGMVLTLCCCSNNGGNGSSAKEEFDESGVKHLYSYYDLRQENPGCEIYGFSNNDPFGRWSNGDTSIVDIMTAPMAEFTAKIYVERVICPDEPFEFDVEVNGAHLSHYATNGQDMIYVNVPKENVGADGSVRMMFIYKNAAYPSKYNPDNHDGRKLGCVISDITVYGYSLNK